MEEPDKNVSLSVSPNEPSSENGAHIIMEKPTNVSLAEVSIQTEYHGPIPTPKMMEDFKKIDPNIPSKIMRWPSNQVTRLQIRLTPRPKKSVPKQRLSELALG